MITKSFQGILSRLHLSRGMTVYLCLVVGVMAGLGLVVVRVSNATSYLSDSPETCINCHVMTDAYASWQRGSHGHTAVCNDCHVPHDNAAAKWVFKGRDGMRHSAIYTMRAEPQVIQLSAGAVPVVQSNCVRCHGGQVSHIRVGGTGERRCWDCHTNVHGEVRSLSASSEILRPKLPHAGLFEVSQRVGPGPTLQEKSKIKMQK